MVVLPTVAAMTVSALADSSGGAYCDPVFIGAGSRTDRRVCYATFAPMSNTLLISHALTTLYHTLQPAPTLQSTRRIQKTILLGFWFDQGGSRQAYSADVNCGPAVLRRENYSPAQVLSGLLRKFLDSVAVVLFESGCLNI